jgi:hypothetical protein
LWLLGLSQELNWGFDLATVYARASGASGRWPISAGPV